ncbi:unnamed protein product [Hermetia illucens]|uniref:K Homology domain-containing protein n=2 Tax=Hermetia illucens TaxID=343691 RepID=A0A7R8UAY7_HERIL|nr:activating signal cointegrator 1 complex subunit 1 isoform X2 [Hermetia illucens]XP_037903551.1 activating signal cointegrator 1 complex subunit 1 isoform X2 [Hermetia illucens]XP_037903552.1 activating signal cointegrator 1 complex subunit 1 isoform X2 [Hermetia illucens]CAD7077191.1 unnamed protein product [Hermetia illucens]
MDVLSPQLVWVGPRCYRVNGSQTLENFATPAETGYVEEDLYSDDEEAEDFKIELTDNQRYKTSYHIPSFFFSQIIGSKGMTKKRIEAETKTQIRIPKPGVEGDVVIIGPTAKSVVSARRKVNLIVLAARNKQQFTHFLCVPFNNQGIIDSYSKFKGQLLAENRTFDESLFQNPKKLHLTLVTLSLMDNEDRAYAAQLLHECHETIIKPTLEDCGPIRVHLRGLEYMNDDPSAVDVLYGKIESEPLQMIADNMADYFTAKRLTQKKTESVKMHVTLINSLFRDDLNQQNEYGQQQRRTTFDARWIMERFGKFEFGSFILTDIHLSQRYSTACDGFYEATAIVKL